MIDKSFIARKGDYHDLIVYRKAECIYDITYYFANHYLGRGDRTVDQMIQVARSGKQNIIEESAASMTSRETEIKLFNVAKVSFHELLADYEDYLRVRSSTDGRPKNKTGYGISAAAIPIRDFTETSSPDVMTRP